MPITVEAPGGIKIDFPDGTDAATIDREMRTVVSKTTGQPITQAPPASTWGAVDAAIQGMPVIGPALRNAGAAGAATIQPFMGQGEDRTFGERYSANRAELEAKSAQYSKEEPGRALTAGLVGGVAGTGPLAMTGLGARALGLVGTLPARMMQGAAGGGIIGTADAYMRDQSPVVGGGLGAGFGVAAPVAGRAAGALVNKVGEKAYPLPGELQGFSRSAVSKVGRAASDDAATVARARELGPQGMMVDLGPNLNAQGQALATQPGSASRVVGSAVTDRFTGADKRIKGDVDTALGPSQNFRETKQAAISERRKAGNELYERAFSNARPVDVSDAIGYIDNTVRPGLSRLVEGGPAPDSIQSVLGRVRNVLAGDGAQRINARDLHVVKMDLDDMIESAVRAGKNNQARVLIDVRNRVVGGLDDATTITPMGQNAGEPISLYKEARSKFKSDSAVINALEDGQGLFKRSTRPDDILAKFKEMSEAEKDSFRIGARDAIDEVMGNVKNDALAARTLFGKDWNQQKLEALVGKERASQLLKTIERENTFAQTYGDIQRGSQTRGRLAAGEEFPNKVSPPSTQLVNPSVLGIGELAIRKGLDMVRSSGRVDRLDREASDAARLLTAQGPERDQFMEAVRRVRQNQQTIEPYANNARDLATLLTQAPRQQLQDSVFSRR